MKERCVRTDFLSKPQTKGLIFFAAAMLGLAASSAVLAKLDLPKKGGEGIMVTAVPFDLDANQPDRRKFGKLVWRGGLVLTSKSPHFGGLSGIALARDGRRLFAVTDRGAWLSARLAYDGRDLRRLENVRMGALLSRKGRKLKKKSKADAEAIDLLPGKGARRTALIAFERRHRVGLFPVSAKGVGAPIKFLPLPPAIKTSKKNKGMEAAVFLTKGWLRGSVLAFAERNLDKAGNLRGWLIGGRRPGELSLKRRKGFDITDAAELPGGDVVVLERRFRLAEGVKMRLRRIRAKDIRPGALLDGEILLEADGRLQIDNMEGLAVHKSRRGETVLTLISDDNFQFLQRTLLMQFTLPPENPARELTKAR